MNVGCVGTGRMGSRMARRLVDGGNRVFIYDVSPANYPALVSAGATVCVTPAALAAQVDFVVTSVPGPPEVEAAIVGADGILQGARAGTLVIETSTIGPAQSRELARRCAERGVRFIDASVSGGMGPAERGTLTAMVGGERTDFEAALPVLRCLAKGIHHLGPLGSGNVAKLINQIVFLSYVALFCEAAGLGRDYGLDIPELVEVLRTSVAGSPLMTGWERHLESGDLKPGFQVMRVLKDLGLGAELCREQNYDAPIFQTALRAFRAAAEAGFADKDMSALFLRKP
jgi:3-hydroxyisobutyrate dehydrogenase-like beta-hydroxyacid dehydrogenase